MERQTDSMIGVNTKTLTNCFLLIALVAPVAQAQTEYSCNKQFCQSVNGLRDWEFTYEKGRIEVDCIGRKKVYEGSLDKRFNLDSVQQATFAAQATGKKGVVVIYDTDGEEGPYEYRIKMAAKLHGIEYISFRCEC